jgi:hypothetical protein
MFQNQCNLKNISIKKLNSLEEFEQWKKENPFNIVNDIQIIDQNNIYIIYRQVNS